ncbi:hypothetical protein DIPPA_70210 [Diplonema papillatum]|nr:hypothetical protein DIPPA_70210 [Diplonema papillatum]
MACKKSQACNDAARAVGELELERLVALGMEKEDCENPGSLALAAGFTPVAPWPVFNPLHSAVFSQFWPESRRGRISKAEIRRMEDFLMTKPLDIRNVAHGRALCRKRCPVLDTHELDFVQMQEFSQNNNETARLRSIADLEKKNSGPQDSPGLLPLWAVLLIPCSVVFLQFWLALYLRSDLFHPMIASTFV